jgi:outer membrane protein assembly factor BamB
VWLLLALGVPAALAWADDWPAYLGGVDHRSFSAETAITPANAATLAPVWTWKLPLPTSGQPSRLLYSSPTVAGGLVFVGSNTGVFYARSVSTGARVWSRNLGYVPALTCNSRGITATATVAPDPARSGAATVYVTGAADKVFAMDAATGTVIWRRQIAPTSTTANAYYGWSSPTVVAGHIYVGLASECDTPLVRGGVVELDQATGTVLHRYWSIGAGQVGGSVWSSVAATADGSVVFATTGNGDEIAGDNQGDSYSIVRLDGTTMKRTSIWTVPGYERPVDSDFGASPTLFTANLGGTPTDLVAACNKDGILYAWQAAKPSAGPVWQTRIDDGGAIANCLAASIFDGTSLYQAGGSTTIDGTAVAGSVSQLDPATGATVWQTELPAAVIGSGSVDAAGVLAVPMQDSSGTNGGVQLLDASTGTLLARLGTANVFAQPVFANGYLLVGSINGTLTAYAPTG